MKEKSRFTQELKTMIEQDIGLCKKTLLTPNEAQSVYKLMLAKYLPIYPHICDGISSNVKNPVKSSWEKELSMFKEALEVILVTKQEPQQLNQPQVSINIKKFKNNGSIGANNNLTKSTQVETNLSVPIQPKVKILKKRK